MHKRRRLNGGDDHGNPTIGDDVAVIRKETGWLSKMKNRSIRKFSLALTDVDPTREYSRVINFVSTARFKGPEMDLRRLNLMMKCMRKTPAFETVYSSFGGTVLWFASKQLVITGNRSLPHIRLVVRLLLLILGNEKLLVELTIPNEMDDIGHDKLPIQRVERRYTKLRSLIRLVKIKSVNVVGTGPVTKTSIDIESIEKKYPQLHWREKEDAFSGNAKWVSFAIPIKECSHVSTLDLHRYATTSLRIRDTKPRGLIDTYNDDDDDDVYDEGHVEIDCKKDKVHVNKKELKQMKGTTFCFGSTVCDVTGDFLLKPRKFDLRRKNDPSTLNTDRLLECSVHLFPETGKCVIMKMSAASEINLVHDVVSRIVKLDDSLVDVLVAPKPTKDEWG